MTTTTIQVHAMGGADCVDHANDIAGERPRAACCAPSRAGSAMTPPATAVALRSGHDTTPGMVRISGGTFRMGGDDDDAFADDGEGPLREVTLSDYLIDASAVTNAQFTAFVDATGYVTEAERLGWSFVFHLLLDRMPSSLPREGVAAQAPWWIAVEGAHWRAPEGRSSNTGSRSDHPVVHVSWHDAAAYAAWADKRLPTEAEWEKAARGGLAHVQFPWGNELKPGGKHRCNIWQGRFPTINTGDDGHVATAPVEAFEPNAFGLYNMSGNVWEWCEDWWSTTWHAENTAATRHDPRGPAEGTAKVIRGGSYLCHASYCNRYRVAARTHNTPASSAGHMGFRCAADLVEARRS
jgi:sulfatase modifying factor 1